FGAALQYFTGSKEHNVRLRELAVKRKWRLNEYGLFAGRRRLAGADEEGIYRKLGLPCFPPELRENHGEFEGDVPLDDLVTLNDIRGDLHVHTTASDGRNTIEEMAEAAKARGYRYLAVCDHSRSATIANGLSIERMKKHVRDIRAADEKIRGITILVGCECDILPDGSLDYPDSILKECDWVVASIHSAMGTGKGKKRTPTERTLAAMENRYVCAIGHPTGRLLGRRAAMELDIGRIAEAAATTGTFLEVNASWPRLDLKDLHIRQALDAGAVLTINTDAHDTGQLDQMRFGIITARRGGATRRAVVNCWTLATLRKRIAAKR
ncbi:MAG: PHP domain-containing protein, partial [Planctomycetota bacterium]